MSSTSTAIIPSTSPTSVMLSTWFVVLAQAQDKKTRNAVHLVRVVDTQRVIRIKANVLHHY
jgi:hypothetical protein